jgi:hypothetical protein
VDELRRKKPSAGQSSPADERRRIGTVVHDERGNASVSWRDAPVEYQRPVLEILGGEPLTLKNEDCHDPYARREARRQGGATRTDLRRLSEWIKMMRELEERKRRDAGDDGGQD